MRIQLFWIAFVAPEAPLNLQISLTDNGLELITPLTRSKLSVKYLRTEK